VKSAVAKIAKEMTDCLEGKLPKEAAYMACKQVPTVYLFRWLQAVSPIPKVRRAPTKSSLERKANRATDKQLLDLWKQIVRKRDGERCRRCKKTERLQVHHIISRSHKRLRYDTTNGLLLCSGCHLWIEGKFGGATERERLTYLENEIGARALLRLEQLKGIKGKPQDMNLVRMLLLKEMTGRD
jgi:HNH endonuclease